MSSRLLYDGFLSAAACHPAHRALEVNGEVWTYAQLRDRAAAIAATLRLHTPAGGPDLTAVFAHRSSCGFAGILGALLAGHGYVPLNRTYPVERTRWMLLNADVRSIVIDSASAPQLRQALHGIEQRLLLVFPDLDDVRQIAAEWPQHNILGSADLESAAKWVRSRQPASDGAYLLFTSGSTGMPKGVLVSHSNATHFIAGMLEEFDITSGDRCSQMFDTTFDLSVLDMFLAWERGACVCCPSEKSLMSPDQFIREHNLTVWSSVPSVALLMKRFGALKKDRYPSLRFSFFCGEPLPVDVAVAWAGAASKSIVENLYGPTELTVACSMYRFDLHRAESDSRHGIVPIGSPFPAMNAVIVDETLGEVPAGSVGELLMSGPQMTSGYWRDPEATKRSYVSIPGKAEIYYRTGDRVRRPLGHEPMTYVGRLDHQIKVLGHRVELGEVESRLREQPGVEAAVALGWPLTAAGAAGIVAFLSGTDLDTVAIRTRLAESLQGYAVPHAIHVLPELPYNANGKVDRQALLRELGA
jgi:amino acid adenylation domain-containing protein